MGSEMCIRDRDKGTVSYHNQKFAKMFREMLSFKDTKPEKEL